MSRNNRNVTKFHTIKTQNKIDNRIGISDRVVQSILKDVSMQHMPHIPKENQMEIENSIVAVLLEWSVQEADFLMKIITRDLSWVLVYDPEMKCQSPEWHINALPWK
jgi:hypothetical protein